MTNDLKALLIFIASFVIQSFAYWGTQFFAKNPNIIGNKIDEKIPFLPIFIYPYVAWYILIPLVPFALYMYSIENFAIYMMALTINNIVSGIIYLIYPTTFDRKDPKGDSFSVKLVLLVYKNDTKILSCLPSLHCALSVLFIIATLYANSLPLVYKISFLVISILVIPATVFVKQHVLVDIIAAIPIAIISWYVALAIGAERFLAFFKF